MPSFFAVTLFRYNERALKIGELQENLFHRLFTMSNFIVVQFRIGDNEMQFRKQ